ncbi:MAG TPA: ester cyclase [Pyrinomonadaceae bacterium]|nr:ester cyclase [Pyrinomonadaceae bacterium]
MKSQTPKEVINQWFERVWNSRDKGAIPLLMTDDAVAHLAGGVQVSGTAEFSGFHNMLLGAFPDLSVRILGSVGDDTQACLHWELHGTHKGEFSVIAPTHKSVCFNGMSFVTVRDGKIAEALLETVVVSVDGEVHHWASKTDTSYDTEKSIYKPSDSRASCGTMESLRLR